MGENKIYPNLEWSNRNSEQMFGYKVYFQVTLQKVVGPYQDSTHEPQTNTQHLKGCERAEKPEAKPLANNTGTG